MTVHLPTLGKPRRGRHDSLTRRASLTAVASLLDFGSRVAVSFLITPIILHTLGRTLYGVWEMLNRLMSHMVATDGRPTEALRLVVASDQRTVDADTHRRNVASALIVWALFLPLVGGLGALVTWLAPTIVHARPELVWPVRLACMLLVGGTIGMTLGAIPQSALDGMNLGYKRMGVQAGVNVAAGVLMVAAVVTGWGLPGLAAGRTVGIVLAAVLLAVLAYRYVDWFGIQRPTRADVRRLFGLSVWIMIGDTLTRIFSSSDVIILGIVRSPAVVTTYVLTGYAMKFLVGVLTTTVGAAMPGFGGLVGAREMERAASSRREILAATWLALTAVGGTILLWNRSLLALWVGPGQGASQLVTLLIVLIGAETIVIRTYVFMIDAALQTPFRVRVGAVGAAATVGLSIGGTIWLGLPGLCLGVLVGRAVQAAANPAYVYRRLFAGEEPQGRRAVRITRAALVTGAVYGGATWLGGQLSPASWITWIGGSLTSALVLCAGTFVLGLHGELRRALWRRAVAVVRHSLG